MVNILLISITVFSAEVMVIGITFGHLLCASTIIKNYCPINGLVKSTCIRCHGADGQLHGCNGVGVTLFRRL